MISHNDKYSHDGVDDPNRIICIKGHRAWSNKIRNELCDIACTCIWTRQAQSNPLRQAPLDHNRFRFAYISSRTRTNESERNVWLQSSWWKSTQNLCGRGRFVRSLFSLFYVVWFDDSEGSADWSNPMQVHARFDDSEQRATQQRDLNNKSTGRHSHFFYVVKDKPGPVYMTSYFQMMIANNAVPDVTRDVWRLFIARICTCRWFSSGFLWWKCSE